MQYVGVKLGGNVYSYQWSGQVPMKVGDRAVVPANWRNPMPSFGDVVTLYETREEIGYKGPLADLMGKVDYEDL